MGLSASADIGALIALARRLRLVRRACAQFLRWHAIGQAGPNTQFLVEAERRPSRHNRLFNH